MTIDEPLPGPADDAGSVMFSFLIPAYRTEHLVSETLDSLLAQTRDDWEAVVVDNGNSDEMAAVVRPYTADPRVRLVRQENKGYAGGVNAAADAAVGRWFVPLCSDDLVLPDYCERMAAAADANPGVHALSPDAQVFDDADRQVRALTFVELSGVRRQRVPRGDLTLADLMNQQFLYYGSAFRRDAWKALGGHHSDTRRVEDLDLWLRLVGGGWSVRAVPDVVGCWRLREDSMSHAADGVDQFEAEAEQAFTRAAHASGRPEDLAALEVAMRRLRYRSAIRRARAAFLAGDDRAAREAARTAVRARTNPRSLTILAGVSVAPGVLRRAWPLKQRTTVRVRRVVARWRGRRAV
ncbi:glycosyltransferase family 2 protein [Actinomycetospora sp. CA-101289]|uniref:glycosyltransferase family 2 protein n=1 Tax=Actinomycetospora sp. CA-101289 TaxID=3239893 RepID=UPI003D98D383